MRHSDRPSMATDRTSSMRKAIRGLSNVDKNNNNKCVVTDLLPESVTTSMPGGQTESNLRKNIWLGVCVELI